MARRDEPPGIFVVDDERIIADTFSLILHAAGFRVTTFYDGSEVLKYPCESHPPDVVVTDLTMPNVDGLTLASWLEKHYPNCRVVVVSGNQAMLSQLAEAGCRFTLLSKPVNPAELIATVKSAI